LFLFVLQAILANAVKSLPTSVRIWLAAADLETNVSRKKAVLMKGLEGIPNSMKLWKAAIELGELFCCCLFVCGFVGR
jgi:pre-mRNA-processing factor 6